jgi:hypothetical protein
MTLSLKKNLINTVGSNLWAGFLLLAGVNPAMAESIFPMLSLSMFSIKTATIRLYKSWLRKIMLKVQCRDLF